MMKALARFLLSLELMFSHPGKWWRDQFWLLKGLLLLSTILIINVGTLFLYQQWFQSSDQATKSSTQTSQEIITLRQQVAELKRQQQDLKGNLPNNEKPVPGVEAAESVKLSFPGVGGGISENLAEESTDEWATESARIVFLPADDGETTPLYKQPQSKSEVATAISTDTWYLIVNKRDGWYQIEVDEDGRIGWIPASVAIEQGLE